MNNQSTQHILLLHLFSNGDCLYATAIARQIKHDFPGSHLTWVISEACKPILDYNPYVDAIRVINDVPKNDLRAYRKLKKTLALEKKDGKYDHLFVTQNMDENQALYDGCIRSGILGAYPHPITQGITPVLILSETEKKRVEHFADLNLKHIKHKIIFEFAPQSGQAPIDLNFAIAIAERITKQRDDVAVILSSANKINHTESRIVDGSVLSLRETAGLTHFCSLLIGCSSGITWAATSSAAKGLPTVQLVDPYTPWLNSLSRDFQRNGFSTKQIIDVTQFDQDYISNCVLLSLDNFYDARNKYNQNIPLKFITSRRIVYNLFTQLQLTAIAKHISVNHKVFGFNPNFYFEIFCGIFLSPIIFIKNSWKKRRWAK